MKSPWICAILLPKPPPTSGAITRKRSSGTPVTSDMMKRTMCGFCVVFQSVSSPVTGTNCATAPRVSIAVGISRCWMIRSRTTTSADCEGGVDVAAGDRPVERDVVGNVAVQLRRALLHGLLRIDDGRQRHRSRRRSASSASCGLRAASRRRPRRPRRRRSARRPWRARDRCAIFKFAVRNQPRARDRVAARLRCRRRCRRRRRRAPLFARARVESS